MKVASVIYLTLAILGVAAAVLLPLTVYRSSSISLPIWRRVASPGPLSVAHAFLGSQCETCHTPDRGIEPASCLTCHAKDIANLRERPAAAFHTTINDCRGCHIEHRGGVRPTKMDHGVLVRIGLNSQPGTRSPGIWRTLSRDLAALFGGSVPDDGTQRLSCIACHGERDRHHGFFGRACGACHATEAWTIAGYVHPAPTSTSCAQCHQAPPSHYTAHFFGMDMMAGGARIEQCYVCHETTNWRDRKSAKSFESH
jgi:hypothetical protein